ncbi:hypothetical protein L21SP2_2878 [Salinispira pacifica]|uniref:Uncharacterized protein n=1 Tax=Salinispira pacifica TaxID=1307761 RepID=V5WM70_9SPIO|nr:hypothetical protein L21SP2_2878 [Salinispira pacifica]
MYQDVLLTNITRPESDRPAAGWDVLLFSIRLLPGDGQKKTQKTPKQVIYAPGTIIERSFISDLR